MATGRVLVLIRERRCAPQTSTRPAQSTESKTKKQIANDAGIRRGRRRRQPLAVQLGLQQLRVRRHCDSYRRRRADFVLEKFRQANRLIRQSQKATRCRNRRQADRNRRKLILLSTQQAER